MRGEIKVQVFRCLAFSRDPCERALINLATARTEYSPGEAAAGVSHSFSIVTYQRGYLIQVSCSPQAIAMAWLFRRRRPATETSTTGFTPSTHSLPVRSSQKQPEVNPPPHRWPKVTERRPPVDLKRRNEVGGPSIGPLLYKLFSQTQQIECFMLNTR